MSKCNKNESLILENFKYWQSRDLYVNLMENFIALSIQAAILSMDVNNNDDTSSSLLYPNSISWTDEPDKAMITKLDNICFVAFRATTWSIDDWWQNLDPAK